MVLAYSTNGAIVEQGCRCRLVNKRGRLGVIRDKLLKMGGVKWN